MIKPLGIMKLFNDFGYTVFSSFIKFFLIILQDLFLFRGFLKRNPTSKLDSILSAITSEGPAIAHRGGIPENTVTAFNRSKLGGAKAVEVDLQFTKDGHPVLFHDWTVDRVSDGSGHLHDMTLKEIQSLDVGYKFGHEGATVPTLYEAVDALKELDMYMLLEVKEGEDKAVSTVIQLFASDPSLYDRIIVISFFPHLLYPIRKLDPHISVGLIIEKTALTIDTSNEFIINSRWKYLLVWTIEKLMGRLLDSFVWRMLGVNLILPDKYDIMENRVCMNYFRSQSVRFITWTVNSDEEKEYFGNTHQIPYMTDYINQYGQVA